MKTGKAYGFLRCSTPKEEIEAELPFIRNLSKTPSELRLSLREGIDNIGDSKLEPIITKARKDAMRYSIKATYAGATNKETADELSVIINQAYQSPLFFDEQFKGKIAYEENGEYVVTEIGK